MRMVEGKKYLQGKILREDILKAILSAGFSMGFQIGGGGEGGIYKLVPHQPTLGELGHNISGGVRGGRVNVKDTPLERHVNVKDFRVIFKEMPSIFEKNLKCD